MADSTVRSISPGAELVRGLMAIPLGDPYIFQAPRMTRRRGLLTVALVVVVGLVATTAVAYWTQQRERADADSSLRRAAERVELAVRAELEGFAVQGIALALLSSQNPDITQGEWASIVEGTTLPNEPVFGINRATFDAGAEHLVIRQVHPLARNRAALGFDILTNPSAAEAVTAAIDAGAPRLSDAITLQQRPGRTDGLVLYAPIAADGAGAADGAVTVVFEGQEIVESVSRLIGVHLAISDAIGSESVALGRSSDPEVFTDRPVVTASVEAYGQRWAIEVASLDLPGSGSAGVVALAGLFATLVLGLLALSVANAEDRAQALVRRKTAELERAAHIKDDIIAVVSHELRTPLTVIWGFASTLLTRERDTLSPIGLTAMDRIERNASRLEALVDEMLTSAQVASGDKVVVPTEVAVAACIDEVARYFVDDGTVVSRVPEGCRVMADSRDVATMLQHLVSNGIKYGGGAVSVTVEQFDDTVQIRVSDGGTGLDPHRAEALFDRFEQGDNGDSRSTRGVGLGLWLVRKLAELNGGRARYRHGSPHAFIVELPSAPASTQTPSTDLLTAPRN